MLIAFDENVLRFEVAVNDSVFKEVNETCEKILEDLNPLLFGEVSATLEFSSEVTSIAVLLDDVVVVGCFKYVNEVDDIFALEFLHNLNL